MAKQSINLGSQANDGTGDSIRDAFDKVNTNFTEVYEDLTLFNSVFSTGTEALAAAIATVYSVTATMANFSATQALFQQDLNDVATLINAKVTSISAGTDTQVVRTSNNVEVSNNSTLQSVTSRGATTTRPISITATTASISTSSGALTVNGGVGVRGDITIGNKILLGDMSLAGANTRTAWTYTNTSVISVWPSLDVSRNGALTSNDGLNFVRFLVGESSVTTSTNYFPQVMNHYANTGTGISIIDVGPTAASVNRENDGAVIFTSANKLTGFIKNYLVVGNILESGAPAQSTPGVTIFNDSTQTMGTYITAVDAIQSSSTMTGALVVNGGVGIRGAVNAGGNIAVTNDVNSVARITVTNPNTGTAAYASVVLATSGTTSFGMFSYPSGDNRGSVLYSNNKNGLTISQNAGEKIDFVLYNSYNQSPRLSIGSTGSILTIDLEVPPTGGYGNNIPGMDSYKRGATVTYTGGETKFGKWRQYHNSEELSWSLVYNSEVNAHSVFPATYAPRDSTNGSAAIVFSNRIDVAEGNSGQNFWSSEWAPVNTTIPATAPDWAAGSAMRHYDNGTLCISNSWGNSCAWNGSPFTSGTYRDAAVVLKSGVTLRNGGYGYSHAIRTSAVDGSFKIQNINSFLSTDYPGIVSIPGTAIGIVDHMVIDISGNTKFGGVVQKKTQYYAPADGTTCTVRPGTEVLFITGSVTSLNLNMPPNPVDGQTFTITCFSGDTATGLNWASGTEYFESVSSITSTTPVSWCFLQGVPARWYRI